MTGEKVAKKLQQDAAAYKAGFADGYRAAKAEITTCKDCRHWLSVPWLPEGRKVCGLTNDVKRACGFCDFVERREEE